MTKKAAAKDRWKGAVFLDRDGVVNEVVFRDGRPGSPRSMAEFRWVNRIQEAVDRLKAASFPVFVVSNQPDVARGKLSAATLDCMSQQVRRFLPIDDILACPHDDPDACSCRKPKHGMLNILAARWQVDLRRSFMVGDSWKDMEAGKRAGCRTILIDKEYNAGTEADFRAADVSSAVEMILKFNEETRG